MIIRRLALVFVAAMLGSALVASLAGCSSGAAPSKSAVPDSGLLINGRQLDPQGVQVELGNFPTGGAVTDARKNAVVNTRYDLPSVLRSMELIMGMEPLSINDAMATPMYDVFTSEPLNAEPVNAIVPAVDLLERNTSASPWAAQSSQLNFAKIDSVPQWQIDEILWKSVYGADSTPPPPGPNAEYEQPGEDGDD